MNYFISVFYKLIIYTIYFLQFIFVRCMINNTRITEKIPKIDLTLPILFSLAF